MLSLSLQSDCEGALSRGLKWVCALAICAALAACGGDPTSITKPSAKVDPKYGVKASPRVVGSGKPVPKGGGRYMVGKPYTIAGKRYYPKEQPNYKKRGKASWYGAAFHGRKTANGEVFDKQSLTAAHPTLPLPSYVKVTNLKNGRSMTVRVNDRGPFHGNRIIDVSERVATMLGFKHDGIGDVEVKYLETARLDGLDERMLLASYNGPNAAPRTMIARAEPSSSRSNTVRVSDRHRLNRPSRSSQRVARQRLARERRPARDVGVRVAQAQPRRVTKPVPSAPLPTKTVAAQPVVTQPEPLPSAVYSEPQVIAPAYAANTPVQLPVGGQSLDDIYYGNIQPASQPINIDPNQPQPRWLRGQTRPLSYSGSSSRINEAFAAIDAAERLAR